MQWRPAEWTSFPYRIDRVIVVDIPSWTPKEKERTLNTEETRVIKYEGSRKRRRRRRNADAIGQIYDCSSHLSDPLFVIDLILKGRQGSNPARPGLSIFAPILKWNGLYFGLALSSLSVCPAIALADT